MRFTLLTRCFLSSSKSHLATVGVGMCKYMGMVVGCWGTGEGSAPSLSTGSAGKSHPALKATLAQPTHPLRIQCQPLVSSCNPSVSETLERAGEINEQLECTKGLRANILAIYLLSRHPHPKLQDLSYPYEICLSLSFFSSPAPFSFLSSLPSVPAWLEQNSNAPLWYSASGVHLARGY